MKCICSYCKQEKEHYAKGFCRPCYARYNKRGTPEYYEHPTTSWYQRNKEKILEYARKYRKEHADKVAVLQSNYYQNHKEKISNYKKEWYLKNRDRILNKGE